MSMNLFISWSGDRSLAVAQALKDWLPMYNNSLATFLSKADVEKGSRWAMEVVEQLANTQFGIICLTTENLNAPWILFESGSLSRAFNQDGRVFTFLLNVKHEDVKGPLAQFQHTLYEKEDFFKMLSEMSKIMTAEQRNEDQKRRTFDALWPQLDDKLNVACKLADTDSSQATTPPSIEDLIADLHSDVRAHRRDLQVLTVRLNEIASSMPRNIVGGGVDGTLISIASGAVSGNITGSIRDDTAGPTTLVISSADNTEEKS
jgi:hypothetical protein